MRGIAKNPIEALLSRPVLVRLGALGLLLSIYLAGSWFPLRVHIAQATAFALDLTGRPAVVTVHGDSVLLTFGAARVAITRACTYLDLTLILIVFTWRLGGPFHRNALRAAAAACAVAALNVARLAAAVAVHAGGAGWTGAHDLPDAALYHAAIAAAVLLCARRDWRMLEARRFAGPPHG